MLTSLPPGGEMYAIEMDDCRVMYFGTIREARGHAILYGLGDEGTDYTVTLWTDEEP